MGKHRKSLKKQRNGEDSNQSQISKPKNEEDEDKESSINIGQTSQPEKKTSRDRRKNHGKEEIHANKFDLIYPTSNSISDKYKDRKFSIDSTNDSASYEEYYENDINSKNYVNQKRKGKVKAPFKSQALDFKIKYKTELCKYYEINGHCKFGDNCAYAHGIDNLRSKVTNTTSYRTKKCTQFFEHGYCPYGNRCQFAHQLKSNIINNPYDRKMTYRKTLETISKLENVENIKKLIEKPRLQAFNEVFENKEGIESNLLEDIKSLALEDIFERVDSGNEEE